MLKDSIFLNIGLTENETKAYRRLLEYGELSPSDLAKLTGITRQNTYTVLKSLDKKGLIEVIDRRKKLAYRSLHPQKLSDYIVNQKLDIEVAENTLNASMPALKGLFNLSNSKTSVSYFEGIEGIKTILEDALRDKPKEVMVFQSIYDQKRLGKYLESYVRRRAFAGIKTRMISPSKNVNGQILNEKSLNRKTKYIPEEHFSLGAEVSFSENLVVILSLEKKIFGTVITSREVARSFKTIFDLIWNTDYSK